MADAPGWLQARWRASLLSLAAGVGIALGQAPFGLFWVALPALGLAIAAGFYTASPRQAALRGILSGLGFGLVTFFWITEPFQVDAARDGWMAPFALFFMALGVALFWALAFWTARRVGGRGAAGLVLAFPVYMTAAEMLRSYAFTGFPWALTSYVWIDTPVYQLAAVTGPHGLTLLTLLVCAAMVRAISRRAIVLAGGTLGLAAGLVAVAVWMQNRPIAGAAGAPADAPRPYVRLIQPNAPQDQKWDPQMMPVFYTRQLRLTGEPSQQPLDLVVWPEVAVPFLLNDPQAPLWEIAGAAPDVPVIIGAQRRENGRVYNSMAVLGEGGEIGAVYDKYHLVPFGEYIPGRALADKIGLRALAAQYGTGYTPGPGPELLDLGPLGRALPLICYEAIFPHEIRRASARPDWMLMLTNDAWFGKALGPYQHFAQARARAIEMALPMLRVANTGISAIIDARGRVSASLPLGVDGRLDGYLPRADAPSIYWRFGDSPTLVLLIVLAIAAAAASRPIPIDPRRGGL